MAKVQGFSQLTKKVQQVSINTFKVRVKNIVDTINSLKNKLINVQKRKLTNTNINDGVTTYPHKRTGNLLNNLIDLKMESFNINRFETKGNIISYTHTSTNMLDGGENGHTVYKVYKGKRYNYAEILQNSNKLSKWNNYYQRLQAIFMNQYYQSVSRILRK